jgi:hypothetical protein
MERDLLSFFKNEVGVQGPEILDPEEYPPDKLRADLNKTERRIKRLDKEIRQLEDEREGIIEEMAEEPSERRKRLLTQEAGDKARQMDTKDGQCDKLFLRRSVIRGVEHVRTRFEDLEIDLAIDDVLEGEDHESVARELEDYLAEQGVHSEGIEAIMQTLDMEMQSDVDSRSNMTDSYAEQAMQEAEQLTANREDVDSHTDDIDTSTESTSQEGVSGTTR